jgi:hypothetical protein
MSEDENLKKQFEEFEEKILSVQNIKYSRDQNLESSIRFDYLCDEFGFEEVNEYLDANSIDVSALANDESFDSVRNGLSNI